MQYVGDDAESRFRRHFHLQRVVQDQVFAVTQVGTPVGVTRSATKRFTVHGVSAARLRALAVLPAVL